MTRDNKKVTSTGDFKLNILKYDTSTEVNEFLDLVKRQWFTPNFDGPTTITSHDKLFLIDNIFLNLNDTHCCSGNYLVENSLPNSQFSNNRKT